MSNINLKESLDLLNSSFDRKINELNQNIYSEIMVEKRKNADILSSYGITIQHNLNNIHVDGKDSYLDELNVHYSKNRLLNSDIVRKK